MDEKDWSYQAGNSHIIIFFYFYYFYYSHLLISKMFFEGIYPNRITTVEL